MYLLYNEHRKKTTSRRLVILARWLTHYFRDNRLCLDAEGGYFCFRTMSINRIKSNSVSFTVSPPISSDFSFLRGCKQTACRLWWPAEHCHIQYIMLCQQQQNLYIKKLFFSCLSARKKSFYFMLFCLSYPRIIYEYVCPCPALGERPKPADSCSGQPQYARLPWPKSLYLLLPQLHTERE